MPDQKISQMDPAAALTGAELVPAVQSGGNVRTTTQDIANLVSLSSLGASANGITLIGHTFAQMRADLGLEAGTDFVAYSAYSANALTLIGHTFAQMRTDLSLVPGTDIQAYSAKLAALAAQTWAADTITYQTSTSAVSTTTLSSFGRTLIDDADAATARTTLGLVIGTNVQAYNANLTTYAGIAPSANAQTLLGHTFSQMRTDLGLVIGTDVQAYDANTAKLNVAHTWSALQTFSSGLTTAGRAILAGGPSSTPSAGAHNNAAQISNTDTTYGLLLGSLATGVGFIQAQRVDGTGTTYGLSIQPNGGATTFGGTVSVPDDAYAAGWDGNLTVPTKNAVYDKIQSLGVLSDGDKGDITVSASGATWTIDNNTVTLAKMATMATDSILGRATASTGNVEVLTALPFAFTGDVTRAADSNAQTIANDAVTYAKMQNVSATDKVLGRSTAGAGDVEEITFTSQARALCDDTSFGAMLTTLGAQASSSILAALAASSVSGTITVSTSAPSGGADGDIWLERAA